MLELAIGACLLCRVCGMSICDDELAFEGRNKIIIIALSLRLKLNIYLPLTFFLKCFN